MKCIAIASEDDRGLDAQVSAHFGRCPAYALVELDGEDVVAHRFVKNPHVGQHQPGQMPRFIRSLGADVILAGGMGPMAVNLFHGFGMDVATGVSGTIRDAVEAYTAGKLKGIVPCNHDHPESCGGHDEEPTRKAEHPVGGSGETRAKNSPARVAVPAMDQSGLASVMDPRFGRASWFVVVDMATGQVVDALINSGAAAAHGAGISAATLMARSGVDAVIAGHFGPKAHQALQAQGIGMWTGDGDLTVGQAVERLRAGELSRQA